MSHSHLTHLLGEIKAGRAGVSEELLPLVYEELRGLARGLMHRQAASHTLQPTALVNEACVKLLGGSSSVSWQNRAHFFAVASIAMRQVLATHARTKRAAKRSAPGERVTLSEASKSESVVGLLALDDALTKLAGLDPRQARLVELRFLAGMTMEEAAHVLEVSVPTAEREWRAARAFLKAELSSASAGDGGGGGSGGAAP